MKFRPYLARGGKSIVVMKKTQRGYWPVYVRLATLPDTKIVYTRKGAA